MCIWFICKWNISFAKVISPLKIFSGSLLSTEQIPSQPAWHPALQACVCPSPRHPISWPQPTTQCFLSTFSFLVSSWMSLAHLLVQHTPIYPSSSSQKYLLSFDFLEFALCLPSSPTSSHSIHFFMYVAFTCWIQLLVYMSLCLFPCGSEASKKIQKRKYSFNSENVFDLRIKKN